MERIFTYLAAFISRFLFCFHASVLIWWVARVRENQDYYWFFLVLSLILVETAVTVFYRRGNEYYWFCPSIFIFTVTEIPCFWLLRLQHVACLQEKTGVVGGITCSTSVDGTNAFGDILRISSDDGSRLSILDQTFVLLLVIGRWMLPKGDISRDQLSSLLLVYIATAADIVELTEIYEEPEVADNDILVRAMLTVWSMSLFQFCLTIMAAETKAKDREELNEQIQKLEALSNEKATKKKIKLNQVAPALYTHKLAHKKALEKQSERLQNVRLKVNQERDVLTIEAGDATQQESDDKNAKQHKGKPRIILESIMNIVKRFQALIYKHLDLIQLLTPMLLQDLPFLIVRLVLVSYYGVTGSGTFLFLTAKNALLVMLQVYRICVLYCQPPEEEQDLFHEEDLIRLRKNVQTAIKSVHGTAQAMRFVAHFNSRRATSNDEAQGAVTTG